MNQENTSDFSDFEKEILRQIEEEHEKEKFREFGKLGGRPKKSRTKNHNLKIRLYSDEKELVQKKADALNMSLSEFGRKAIINKKLPDPEETKELVKYRTNFKRIANFMNRDFWEAGEREELKAEVLRTAQEIRKYLDIRAKW